MSQSHFVVRCRASLSCFTLATGAELDAESRATTGNGCVPRTCDTQSVLEIIEVHVEQDHLQRLIHSSQPLKAVAELIWNALDADATSVVVKVVESELGGVQALHVEDDGLGMTPMEAKGGSVTLEDLGSDMQAAQSPLIAPSTDEKVREGGERTRLVSGSGG